MTIEQLQEEIHRVAREHGWWADVGPEGKNERAIPEKLCLIHSEISEALEEYRNLAVGVPVNFTYHKDKKPEGFAIELADAVIRILDLCGALDIDLALAIKVKMGYNATRPYKHGGKRV